MRRPKDSEFRIDWTVVSLSSSVVELSKLIYTNDHYVAREALPPTAEYVERSLLSETTEIQKCLHKLMNDKPTMHRGKRQIEVFHWKSHHNITMSRRGT